MRKSLSKITAQYACVMSGQKRMQPCMGCPSPKDCTTKSMQYKGSEVSDYPNLTVKHDIATNTLQIAQCAKSLEVDACGYKSGAKVCGKCGAMPMVEDDEKGFKPYMAGDEMPINRQPKTNAVGGDATGAPDDDDPEGETDEPPLKRAATGKGMDEEMDEEMEEEELPRRKPVMDDEPVLDDEDEETKRMAQEEEEDEFLASMLKRRREARARRMGSMGVKSADYDDEAYLCGVDRKVLPGSAAPCTNCPGGCAPESNFPTLLEIEGMAEEMFGKVLDSGYGAGVDMFLVDVQRKDGKVIEVAFDGTTGECTGWRLLNTDIIGEKTADATTVIGSVDAAEIAVKSVEGVVRNVDADEFDGYEAWAVEIDALDGKSYDVFVSLDGKVLGYDEYTLEEAEDIEAQAAEIVLKTAYSDDDRERMAAEGQALPDGSFAIADDEDLRNAIKAYSRAGDKVQVKAHIMKRAEELGAGDVIPEHWVKGEEPEVKSGESEESVPESEILAALMEFELLSVETELDQ